MQAAEREFLRTVRGAIFSNPFGRTRSELDLEATGLAPGSADEDVLARLVEKVGATIGAIRERIARDGSQPAAEERQLLEYGMLFHAFHLFCDDYDAHIQEQLRRGDECCPLSFAGDLLSLLSGYGFADRDARRFLALFFQMRRAYFFIRIIAGRSRSVIELRRRLWNNVFTGDIAVYDRYLWDRMEDFSTMILGETGTGKGMAAAAIGRSGFIPFNEKTGAFSESFARAFVAINLSQYPEQLIESELFGHRKGAFTGAIDSHRGIFSRCSPCGAIFLDEIGDVAVPVQIKLLQVIQERTFTPVGSHKSEKFQGRVIAATNRDLQMLREGGEFRDDFYYRLCSDVIEVPPLRKRLAERPEELRDLLEVTVRRILGRQSLELTERLHETIATSQPAGYPWPGNIRELEQCVRQTMLSGKYAWRPPVTGDDPASRLAHAVSSGTLTAQQILAGYCALLYQRHGTYGEVANVTGLDRRTVKKHIDSLTLTESTAKNE